MKIIFFIPNLSSGGAERVISILANSLVNKKYDVDIVCLQDNVISYPLSDKVNIVCFDKNLLTCSKKLSFSILRNYLKNERKANNRIVLIPFLDVCLTRVIVASFGLNIPIIASERNDPFQKGSSFLARLKANIPYWLSTHCVFQTEGARDYFYKIIRKKSNIIMNPIMMSPDIKWEGQNSKRIISVGRLESQKNHILLIDAFTHIHNEYPDYILEIYGVGSLKSELQKHISELSLDSSVKLCGHSSDIHSLLENSFLFVLSSDYEGMSNALIEALAVGMPVVTTDHPCGGARMLVKNDINGILVPVRDEIALAEAIKRVIENPEFRLSIGNNASEIRQILSVKQISEKWIELIESL